MKIQLSNPIAIVVLLLLVCTQSFAQADLETAQQLLRQKARELQLKPGDFDCLQLKNQYQSRQSGVMNSYYAQCYEGIEVYNAIFNIHFTKEGELLTWGSRLVPDLKANIIGRLPKITPVQAVAAAAQQLGYDFQQLPKVKNTPGGLAQEVVFEKGSLSIEDIPVRLIYQPMTDGTVHLAWDLNIYQQDGQHWWSVAVDAGNGQILRKDDWVVSCNFGHPDGDDCHQHHDFSSISNGLNQPLAPVNLAMSGVYNVYPQPVESPSHGSRQLISDPEDLTASPFGWHDTSGVAGADFTITRGNNVYAQLDDDDNNNTFGFAPDGGPGLVFDYAIDLGQAPSTYASAAITNLFYWNNYMHDLMYGYGFDEGSGNFQQNNYGNGGAGSDYVIADAQDAGGLNNANFATPPDGSRPRMQMYLWDQTSPLRDGDLDNGIIAHEYGHGISIRQTGGPGNSGCLNNSEQMGEGWSDYYSLMTTLEPGDMGTDSRGIGTYALGQPPTGNGIRPTPYSTLLSVNPTTYDDIGGLAIPHGVGYAWCTMIWEMTWGIIAQDGMAAGFDVAMNLVNEGLKLQPCSPGFVDGRDAILAADVALYGGAHTCTIWTAFAKRGLGFSADQGSSGSTSDGTEAFDMPPSCTLEAMPASVSVCQPANAEYVFSVGPGNGNVTLSATAGVPAGAVVAFSVNPVPPSGSSTMTISNTSAVAPGTYTITVEGVGASTTVSTDVSFTVHASSPTVPVLQTPADNATGVSILPALDWTGSGADGYTVQVASDVAFTNIVETAMPQNATYTLTNALLPLTTYYWRVKAMNPCGETAYSPVFTFTTANVLCDSWASSNVPVTIPSNAATTVTSTLNIPAFGSILDVNVIGLDITHSWVNDLIITLTSPEGTTVTLMDQPCEGDNDVLINFDDEAASPNFPCPPTDNGTYQPFSPLSAFDGENLSGTWTLSVEDVFPADGGTLNDWSLNICYIPVEYCASGPMDPGDTKIDSVHFNTIAIGSPPTTCETYTDNTSLNTTVMAGSSYDLTIVNGSCSGNHYPAYAAAYIDYNNDGDFEDTGELVYSFGPTTGLNTIPVGNIAIPAMASAGDRRMRIVFSEDGVDPPSCGTYSYGETEDYLITIDPPIVYCESGSVSTGDTKIDSVHFNTIAIGSPPTTCETYTDNTSLSTTVNAGSSYDLTIVNGSCSGNHYTAYAAAYIDFNNDGDFEDVGELVYSFGPTTGLNTIPIGNITIPAMAPVGDKRMRIVFWEGGVVPPPCGTYSYGETEDYTITIDGPVEYCASEPTFSDDTKIDSVHFNTIAIGSPATTCETYTDNTSLSTTVVAGGTYGLTIVNGSCSGAPYPAYAATYIDFNNDGDFDDTGELVYSFGPTTGLNTIPIGSITIPAMAPVGDKRMRIVFSEDGADPPACGAYSFGETEDYTITIVEPVCPPPANLMTANITQTSADLTWAPGGSCAVGAEYWVLANPSSAPVTGTGTAVGCSPAFPINVTGLMANGTYDVWVYEDCGINGMAGPVNIGTFSTLPPPLSNPSDCQLNLGLDDDNCPVNNVFQINVATAPGTALGTDVFVTDVKLIIGHTWTGDLQISLVSPNGVSVLLSSFNGGSGDNYGNPNDNTCAQVTNFNMTGADGPIGDGTAPFIGSFIPEGDFTSFNDGSSPIGLWELRICDGAGQDIGTLQYVAISFSDPCVPVTWTGGGDALNWSDPANWDGGNVPLPCQDVIIGSGMNVIVPTGYQAVGKTLDVQTGAVLTTEMTGTLIIEN
ncbi:MAG: M36 family metallopeptidase [Lewinellaceae bacterium]|nr:M36 family metallopeptidase [Lewinellaceae bacterium]